jgi:hypothetical protein
LDHPEQAAIMGANGRRLVEETMGLDHFVERVAATIRHEHPVLAGAPIGVASVFDSEMEAAVGRS